MSTAGTRETVTSEAVLDAALTLFAQRSYHGTALSQIAERLEVRTPSLYNHMRSTHDLLLTVVERTANAVLDEFRVATADRSDPLDRLYHATLVYARRHASHRREAIVVNRDASSLDEPHRSEMQGLRRRHEHALRDIITEGAAAGRSPSTPPPLAPSPSERCASASPAGSRTRAR